MGIGIGFIFNFCSSVFLPPSFSPSSPVSLFAILMGGVCWCCLLCYNDSLAVRWQTGAWGVGGLVLN